MFESTTTQYSIDSDEMSTTRAYTDLTTTERHKYAVDTTTEFDVLARTAGTISAIAEPESSTITQTDDKFTTNAFTNRHVHMTTTESLFSSSIDDRAGISTTIQQDVHISTTTGDMERSTIDRDRTGFTTESGDADNMTPSSPYIFESTTQSDSSREKSTEPSTTNIVPVVTITTNIPESTTDVPNIMKVPDQRASTVHNDLTTEMFVTDTSTQSILTTIIPITTEMSLRSNSVNVTTTVPDQSTNVPYVNIADKFATDGPINAEDHTINTTNIDNHLKPSNETVVYDQSTATVTAEMAYTTMPSPSQIGHDCTHDSNCTQTETCIRSHCTDPCYFYHPCPPSIKCLTIEHEAKCLCHETLPTSATIACKSIPGKRKSPKFNYDCSKQKKSSIEKNKNARNYRIKSKSKHLSIHNCSSFILNI